MSFYNVYTGEISEKDSWEVREICKNWIPYYNLKGEYIGAKEGAFGYRVANRVLMYVSSYWDL